MSEKDNQFGIMELRRKDLDPDPFKQFDHWYETASSNNIRHPEAFVLSTVDVDGRPSSRVLLYKGRDDVGFKFYTNINSKKGQDLEHNETASMCFWWNELERQLRIDGKVEKLPDRVVDDYFNSRPVGSQLGAWASDQSSVVENREVLEEKYKFYEEKFSDQKIPRPLYWLGYKVIPNEFEFWQGRKNRLHDRFKYTKSNDFWKIERLAP